MSGMELHIEPDLYPPAAEEHLNEMAEKLPRAYQYLSDSRFAMEKAERARGMVGGALATILRRRRAKVEEAYHLIGQAIIEMQRDLRQLEGSDR